MSRKELNKDQELIVYCLVSRLRHPNYNSGFEGFGFVFEEIKYAVNLYVEVSGIKDDLRNKARKKFDGITLDEMEKGKVEGIINSFQAEAKNKAKSMDNYIHKLILPSKLDDYGMEFWSDHSKNRRVSIYFNSTISCLRYRHGAFKDSGNSRVAGREAELVPCGRISKDSLSKFDTYFKKLGLLLEFDKNLLEWITNRVKIESPYSYRIVKPSVGSIIDEMKARYTEEELNNKEANNLAAEAANDFELDNKPDYILNPSKYRDLLRKRFKRNF